MNNINKSLLDFLEIGVICSGGDPNSEEGDHPNDRSSNQKVIFPLTHDPENVKQDHLAFSPMSHSPTAGSQYTFQGALDPGSLVYAIKFPGQTGSIILGQANDLMNSSKGGSGGGTNLLGKQYYQDLFKRKTGAHIPPNIKEHEEDGVKVKAITEKQEMHSHSLLKGLSTHNAQQPTTGYKLDEQKNIPTAKQHFQELATGDLMNKIPGNIMSLSQMFQGLSGGGSGSSQAGGSPQAGTGSGQQTSMDKIKSSIDPNVYDALSSLSVLVQGSEDTNTASFFTSSRVHYDTYMTNAETLLSQVTTLDDMFNVLHRLQYDEELFGHENLEDEIVSIDTAWGEANLKIGISGIDIEYANSNVQSDFAQSMSSPSSSPSSSGGGSGNGAGGGNMFGNSSDTMMDMFKRLAPNNQKEAKKMHEKLNTSDDAKKLWKFAEKTLKGGNPLDPENFSS